MHMLGGFLAIALKINFILGTLYFALNRESTRKDPVNTYLKHACKYVAADTRVVDTSPFFRGMNRVHYLQNFAGTWFTD